MEHYKKRNLLCVATFVHNKVFIMGLEYNCDNASVLLLLHHL